MTPITTEQFISRFLPAAQATERSHGLPAFYTLAMHLSEQGRNLTPPGNMCFGIKADPSWKGKRQLLLTWEWYATAAPRHQYTIRTEPLNGGFKHIIKDWFRAYDSIEESYADHAAFLRKNRRYAPAFAVAKGDDEGFARAVAAAGYSTDPLKFQKLRDIISYLKKKAQALGLSLEPPVPASSPSPAWPTSWPAPAADSTPGAELPAAAAPGAGI